MSTALVGPEISEMNPQQVREPLFGQENVSQTESNVTVYSSAGLQESQSLKLVYDITITCTLVIIILGMGCGVTPDLIKLHLKRPTGIAIGLLSQIIILPFLSFALAHSLGFQTIPAVGMLVMAVSPCGMMSSVFSYWVDGDVSLR